MSGGRPNPHAPLARAVAAGLARRRLSMAELARHDAGALSTSLYRAANGSVPNPSLRTVLVLCARLGTDPTTLLTQAGLWPESAAPTDHGC